MTVTRKPLIGLPGRRKTGAEVAGFPGSLVTIDIDIYLADYARSVLSAGGLPVHLPLDADPRQFVDHLDGIILPGGADVSPARYGHDNTASEFDDQRDDIEFALLEGALERDMPVLGICRGLQVLNVLAGGTLHQDVPEHSRYDVDRSERIHEASVVPGSRMHGAEFIEYALRMDAAAILTDAEGARIAAAELAGSDAAVVVSDQPRETLSRAAALFFGAQPETMVAVTGTNGKTSVSSFVRQIWIEMGIAAVNLGTTGVEGAWSAPLEHTTPEPITLHRTLAQARIQGITHAAMEASSHGLDQRRLDGVTLTAAGFTNFTQDHLD